MTMHLHGNDLTVNDAENRNERKGLGIRCIYMICLSCISAKWIIYLSNFLKFQLFIKINGEIRNRL